MHFSFNDPCKSTSVNRYSEISFEATRTYCKLGRTQPKKIPTPSYNLKLGDLVVQ